jgi:ABC-type taurine transport system ATPase subunit
MGACVTKVVEVLRRRVRLALVLGVDPETALLEAPLIALDARMCDEVRRVGSFRSERCPGQFAGGVHR